jgi:hypothetical protein
MVMHILEHMVNGTTVMTHSVHVRHNCEKSQNIFKQLKSLTQWPLVKVESALAAWFKQACANNGSVGGTVIRDKALHVAACLGVDNCTGSSGWIDKLRDISSR